MSKKLLFWKQELFNSIVVLATTYSITAPLLLTLCVVEPKPNQLLTGYSSQPFSNRGKTKPNQTKIQVSAWVTSTPNWKPLYDGQFKWSCVSLLALVASQWLGLFLQFIGVAMVTAVAFIAVLEHHFSTVDPGKWRNISKTKKFRCLRDYCPCTLRAFQALNKGSSRCDCVIVLHITGKARFWRPRFRTAVTGRHGKSWFRFYCAHAFKFDNGADHT